MKDYLEDGLNASGSVLKMSVLCWEDRTAGFSTGSETVNLFISIINTPSLCLTSSKFSTDNWQSDF